MPDTPLTPDFSTLTTPLDGVVNMAKPSQPKVDWAALALQAAGTVKALAQVQAAQQMAQMAAPTPWQNMGARLVGGVAGGVAGSALGPVGAAAGAAMGTTLASNLWAQPREVSQGLREGVNPLVGAIEGASAMLPAGSVGAGPLLRQMPKLAMAGAAGNAATSPFLQLAETGQVSMGQVGQDALMGAVAGPILGGAPAGIARLAKNPGVRRAVTKLATDETGSVGPRIQQAMPQQPDANPGGGAPEPTVTTDPARIANKVWWHGSGTRGLSPQSVEAGKTSAHSLFGPGLYMTDAGDIARGYARSRGGDDTPVMYQGRVNVTKVFNLEDEAPQDVRDLFEAAAGWAGFDDEQIQIARDNINYLSQHERADEHGNYGPISGELLFEVYREAAEGPQQEAFLRGINAVLVDNGYDALTHTGGLRTGNAPHQVLILLDPNGARTGEPPNITRLISEPYDASKRPDAGLPAVRDRAEVDLVRPPAAARQFVPRRPTPPPSAGAASSQVDAPEVPTEAGEWRRIAGENLGAGARGVLDNVPVPERMTPAGLAPSAIKANTERTLRFIERHKVSPEAKQQAVDLLQSGEDYLWQKQRRSGQTWEQLDALASQILPEIKLPKGSIVSPEEMGALRRQSFGLLERAKDVSEDVAGIRAFEGGLSTGDPAALAARDALLQKYGVSDLGQLRVLEKQAVEEAVVAQKSLMGVRSEFGRGLNYLKSLQAARNTTDADFLASALKGGAVPEDAMAALRVMDTPLKRYQFLKSLAKPNAQDYWRWYAMNAYLSGPVTQWRNLVGNAANFGAESILVNPIAAGIDAVRNPSNRQVYLKESQAAAAGLSSGFLDGVGKALFYFKNGFTTDDVAGNVELPPEVFGGAIAPNVVGRTMGAVDQFFRTVGFSMEVHRQATVQGVKEGLTGSALAQRVAELVADPTITPEIHKRAKRYATELTYQERNDGVVTSSLVGGAKRLATGLDAGSKAVADFAWEHARLKRMGAVGGATYGLLSFPPSVIVAPFINTPFNILKRAGQYSLGSVMAAKGGDRDAMLNAARGAVGLATMGAAVGLYQQGLMTGAAPADQTEADAFYASKRPYAVRIGNQWVSYQSLGPLGAVLGSVANYMQAAERSPKDTLGKFGQLAGATGKMVIDSSFLKGMYNLLDAVVNYERSGDKWAARTATGLLPAAGAMRFARDQVDGTLRNPEGVREQVAASLPGLSRNVTPRVNFTGQEIQRPSSILPTAAKDDPVRAELMRLRMADPSGKDGYFRDPEGAAGALEAKINTRLKEAGHPPIEVPRDLQTRYAKKYGRVSERVLTQILQAPDYQRVDDEGKRRMIERAKDTITDQLDAAFIGDFLRSRQ